VKIGSGDEEMDLEEDGMLSGKGGRENVRKCD
jgi:hypothetical protein